MTVQRKTDVSWVYGLTDPRNGRLRYVGYSSNPWLRLARHVSEAKHGRDDHRHRWIRAVRPERPAVLILASAHPSEVGGLERQWIGALKTSCDLVNQTDGGDGWPKGKPGYWKGKTKETHAGLASAARKMRGRIPWSKGLTKDTDLRLARMGEKLKGNQHTKGHKGHGPGRPMDDDWRRNISMSLRGKESWAKGLTKETDDRVARGAASRLGKSLSAIHRKRISDAMKGQVTGWMKGLSKETDERVAKHAAFMRTMKRDTKGRLISA